MWLLLKEKLEAMRYGAQPGAISAEARAEFAAFSGGIEAAETPRIYNEAGDRAQIVVEGVLTDKPDILAYLFGGGNTTYGEISAAIDAAERDPAIREIYMYIDSPGGTVAGLFDAIASMQTAKKPITAIGRNTVASAAYGLASQADKIYSSNNATRFGSVGVVVDMYIDENFVSIASTNAPKKRPDVTTEQGRADVRAELDDLAELFVEAIATGRNTTLEKVNADFGMGAMLIAKKAQQQGMIDGLQPAATAATATATGGNKQEEASKMDLETLKAQHPGVYAAAVAEGEAKERDRVSAHLELGKASGAMDVATAAISDGSGLTAGLQAKYMAAGMSKNDRNADLQDDAETGASTKTQTTEPNAADNQGAEVARLIEEQMGIESSSAEA